MERQDFFVSELSEEERRLGLIAGNQRGFIKVTDIVEAARKDSFTTYLKAHNLEGPDPPQPNDWYNAHDCLYLRTRGFLTRKGYGTLIVYISIAQLADYLDNLPNREKEIDWRKLTITDARVLSARLATDLGIRPRNMGSFIHSIVRASHAARANLALYGGKKLIKPPPWCVYKVKWDEVLAEERVRHYTAQAERQGSARALTSLPPYGSRTSKARAPRRTKRQMAADREEISSQFSLRGTPEEDEEKEEDAKSTTSSSPPTSERESTPPPKRRLKDARPTFSQTRKVRAASPKPAPPVIYSDSESCS